MRLNNSLFCNFNQQNNKDMQKFEYSIWAKFFYRFINFFISLFLIFFTLAALIVSFQKWYFIFLVLFNLAILFLLNKTYYHSYKTMPSKIIADDEKIICSKFFLSKKEITVYYKNIDLIEGGIFSGMPMRAVYLHDSKNKNVIGFYSHLGKFNELLKIILKNVSDEVYQNQLERLKKISGGK